MAHLYWKPPLISPFLVVSSMNSNNNGKSLKRSRSTESIEKAMKRSRPFQSNNENYEASSISSTSSTHSGLVIPSATETPIPNQPLYPLQQSVLKPISISTRTLPPSVSPSSFVARSEISQLDYRNMNDMLYSIHVERYGDPEERESWWKNNEIDSMDIDSEQIQLNDTANEYYTASNSILKQAFLERHFQQQ